MLETCVWSLGQEDPLEKEMATHGILAWAIPWIEEPGGLQFMGSKEAGKIHGDSLLAELTGISSSLGGKTGRGEE